MAKVAVQGGDTAELEVTVDPDKLVAFGLTLDDVAKALSASNVLSAVGKLEEHDKLYLVLADTRLDAVNDVQNTVIRAARDGLVLLEDLATVAPGRAPRWTRVTAEGKNAVLVLVYQQPGGNTVAVADGVRAKLADLEARLPAGIHIANWYDQSDLIISSATSVRDAVLIGIGMAILVLLVFLQNLRVTLIAGLTVPAVLAVTTLLLAVLGMSFNIMTLGGMAAAVGLIIDDAIVMVEHIMRRLRGGAGDHRARVLAAAAEFTRPLSGSSASTIIIFAPLALLSGVTGAFFKALSVTMAASLVVSFLIAWLAVPLLSVHLLREKDAEHRPPGRLTRAMHRGYRAAMGGMLRRPWLALLIVVPLFAAGYVAFRHTGSGFMPQMDEGGFILDYRTSDAGTSLSETDRLLREVEDILRATPEVDTWSRRTGLQLGGSVTEANQGDFFVRLRPPPRRGIEAVMNDVRARVERRVPGLEIEMALLMEDLIGDLTAVPQPIEIQLYSDDQSQLLDLAPKVAEAISKVDGVVDVTDGVVLAGDALSVTVDREKAAIEGVDPEAITATLEAAVSGTVTTFIQRTPKMVGVRVWLPRAERDRADRLAKLLVRAPDGHVFPLGRVATLKTVTGQPQIDRNDFKQMVAVTGRISGRDMGSTVSDVKAALDGGDLLPKGVYYHLGGLYAQQREAFRGLAQVFAGAVALVFFLLLFLYERFRVAAAMLVTTLLAAAAVFIGLWLTGTELNITAMMGMTMVIGIVTEVSIFYYSELVELDDVPDPTTRAITAGTNRMRPILMTTLAAILALMPLVLDPGQGAAMQRPLAIAIISGLAVQVPLVLTVLPALLSLTRGLPRSGAQVR